MEKIESFIIDEATLSLPFYIELAGITYPSTNYAISRSSSGCFVIEYIIKGTGTVNVNGETFSPEKGDVYLLPYGSRHNYFASKTDPYEKIWMNVNGPLCSSLIELYSLSGKYHFKDVPVYHLFRQMLSVCEDKSILPKDVHKRCALIFHEIISSISASISKDTGENSYASRAKLFCDQNVYEKLTAEDVSKKIGLSISQLNRLFKRDYSTTVYSYILDSKIKTAKTLLSSTSMQISRISLMLKFTDEHYFTKIFKNKTGKTPSEWRMMQKNQNE